MIDSRPRLFRPRNVVLAMLFAALIATTMWVYGIVHMPLESYHGQLQSPSQDEQAISKNLKADVENLSVTIGERNLDHYEALQSAADYLRRRLKDLGYDPAAQTYTVRGRSVTNISAQVTGTREPQEIIVIGAHYDSVTGTPGANDNATGTAAVLELARLLHDSHPNKTIRFVFFTNEEPPYFQTDEMGSLVYAKQLRRDGTNVRGMIAVETIGYYSDTAGSQHYPSLLSLFYPDTGNFIGFVGDPNSRALLHRCIKVFRESTNFPSEGAAPPPDIPGVGWSDHWSFWQQGWPAVEVTDTALFRYRDYHLPSDTLEKLDFNRMARVVSGLEAVAKDLASGQ